MRLLPWMLVVLSAAAQTTDSAFDALQKAYDALKKKYDSGRAFLDLYQKTVKRK